MPAGPNTPKDISDAGAQAIELNVYYIPADVGIAARDVEQRYIDIVKHVKDSVSIPVSVKLNPFFSSIGEMASRFVEAGADGLVLFNRFYQPDFDLEELEVVPNLELSSAAEIRLPLMWIAILHGRVEASLAATRGVETAQEVVKYLMAGADVVMTTSALLRNGVRPHENPGRRLERVDGKAGLRLRRANERLDEPAEGGRSLRLRTGELHQDAGQLQEPLHGLRPTGDRFGKVGRLDSQCGESGGPHSALAHAGRHEARRFICRLLAHFYGRGPASCPGPRAETNQWPSCGRAMESVAARQRIRAIGSGDTCRRASHVSPQSGQCRRNRRAGELPTGGVGRRHPGVPSSESCVEGDPVIGGMAVFVGPVRSGDSSIVRLTVGGQRASTATGAACQAEPGADIAFGRDRRPWTAVEHRLIEASHIRRDRVNPCFDPTASAAAGERGPIDGPILQTRSACHDR